MARHVHLAVNVQSKWPSCTLGSRRLPRTALAHHAARMACMTRRELRALLVLFSIFLPACELERVAASTLVTAGQADAMRATRDWKGERVVVTGIVESRDLVDWNREGMEGTVGPFHSLSARRVVERVSTPLIVLSGAHCYFAEKYLDEVTEVAVGQQLALECTVLEFRTLPTGRVPILGKCTFE